MDELITFAISLSLAGLIFFVAKMLDKKQEEKIAMKNGETNDFEEEED